MARLRVLVACEYSGRVRNAFIAKGHDAFSCDLIPSDDGGPHILGDAVDALKLGWDLVIAHPPCTYLCNSGARWMYDDRYPNRANDRILAANFFMKFVDCADRWAIENPIGFMSRHFRKPDQIVRPFEHGDNSTKATCLWLGGLPKLRPSNVIEPTMIATSTGKKFDQWYWNTSRLSLKDRAKARSLTFQGIANAMAEQWG